MMKDSDKTTSVVGERGHFNPEDPKYPAFNEQQALAPTNFKEDCPHYESRDHIEKYSKPTKLPENPKLHWCGDKGEWIEKCDNPCERYDLLKDFISDNK